MRLLGMREHCPTIVLRNAIRKFIADDMVTYAAALAYYALFALIPFLTVLTGVLSLFQRGDVFDWLVRQAQWVVPSQAMDLVIQMIEEVNTKGKGGFLSIGIVTTIWAASVGTRASMRALNVAFDAPAARPVWKRYPISIAFTLGSVMLLILATGLMLVGPTVIVWLADRAGYAHSASIVWSWLSVPFAILLLIINVAIVYSVVPNIKQSFRLITPGSVVAVAAWVVASYGFANIVSKVVDYNAVYGSLSAVLVLLLYMYISCAALLFGAEVNAVIYNRPDETGTRY